MDAHLNSWHDRQVANAADAWLSYPDDTTAYARLVRAVQDRRAASNPALPGLTSELTADTAPSAPDILDSVGDDHPPQPISQILGANSDPRATLEQLRAGSGG